MALVSAELSSAIKIRFSGICPRSTAPNPSEKAAPSRSLGMCAGMTGLSMADAVMELGERGRDFCAFVDSEGLSLEGSFRIFSFPIGGPKRRGRGGLSVLGVSTFLDFEGLTSFSKSRFALWDFDASRCSLSTSKQWRSIASSSSRSARERMSNPSGSARALHSSIAEVKS